MAKILATDYYLPNSILSNEMIQTDYPEWTVDKIFNKIGIKSRHISGNEEFASDLALKAAENLFANYSIDRKKIDYLLYCTQSPDYFLPTTACIIQDKLGLNKTIGALDFNLGCSGYIYGLGLAKGIIETNQANAVLLITAETYSKYINPKDKGNRSLFGDAASASLLVSDNLEIENLDGGNIGNIVYGTDGSGFDKLIVRNGAIRYKNEKGVNIEGENGFIRNDDNLFMDGAAIFNFTSFEIPILIQRILEKENLLIDDIDLYIFHQANKYMLETLRRRCKIPSEKFYVEIKETGNTVSSTIPIALSDAIRNGVIKKGMKVILAGFGVGLSMGAMLVRF